VKEGLQIAIDEISGAEGIGGQLMIETIEKDIRSDPAQTSIGVQELIDGGVSVLIVPCDAGPAFAAAALAGEAKVPAFSTCASSPTLPLMGSDYMFANFPERQCAGHRRRQRLADPGQGRRARAGGAAVARTGADSGAAHELRAQASGTRWLLWNPLGKRPADA
jgi:hypothetical protein